MKYAIHYDGEFLGTFQTDDDKIIDFIRETAPFDAEITSL